MGVMLNVSWWIMEKGRYCKGDRFCIRVCLVWVYGDGGRRCVGCGRSIGAGCLRCIHVASGQVLSQGNVHLVKGMCGRAHDCVGGLAECSLKG